MGQVYEAEDLELMDRVALKIIRPDVARDARAVERFRREVYLARKVTHPNVCRIFDLFRHRVPPLAPGDREREIALVTMQFLPGETLSQRLRRAGPFTTAEALPLVRQMIAALAAAHDVGIVHRDFKPGNVLLVGQGSDVRAVVTDFGLAYSAGAGATAPEPALLQGTAAYMSPEQVAGGTMGTGVDIYALGITLYEIVTGRLPFESDSSANAATKRLREPPVSPVVHVPTLDAVWVATILRCLERDPRLRFGSVRDVEQALLGIKPEIQRRRSIAQALVAVALVAALLLSVGVWRRWRRAQESASTPTAAPSKTRRSVALLGFKNLSGRPEAAWLSAALAETLAAELAAGESLRTISGEDVARAKLELAVPEADSLARDTLLRLHRSLGSDLVVLGSYLALPDGRGQKIRLDLRVQDSAAGETVAVVSETGTDAGLLELVSRVGAALRERLGVGVVPAERLAEARASRPATPEAARHYAEGLARLRQFDPLAARGLLEKAVAADASHPLAHAALAEAWNALGYDARARSEAARALELAGGLSREERLSIEGRERVAAGDWVRAIEVYRLLSGFFPDDLEYGLRLASTQIDGGRAADASATIDALRQLPAPLGDDPRIDVLEAQAAGALSDFRRQQAAAAKAAAKAEARGARHLLARAAQEEGNALWGLGETKNAQAVNMKARQMFEESGDRAAVASVVNTMAGLPYERGDFAAARQMFSEALAASREIGDRRRTGRYLGNVAETEAQLGELATAERTYREAMALNRESEYKTPLADNLIGLGAVLAARGELAAAEKSYREAQALAIEVGDRRHHGYALHGLGRLLLARGDLAGARRAQEEGLALREQIGQKVAIAVSELSLAELALEEARPAVAVGLARSAVLEFAREGFRDYEAQARGMLARALATAHDAGASEQLALAQRLAAQSQNPQVRLGVALAAGHVLSGRAAARALEQAGAEATAKGLVALGLGVGVAQAEVEAAAGTPWPIARRRALAREARTRGFEGFARRLESQS
jgi:tetratricopeptide (TPR) repeat protein/TolB-like protein